MNQSNSSLVLGGDFNICPDPEVDKIGGINVAKSKVNRDVNGHRKQQTESYREPTNTVSFSNFIDARLTYNNRCMAVLTGALRTSGPQR